MSDDVTMARLDDEITWYEPSYFKALNSKHKDEIEVLSCSAGTNPANIKASSRAQTCVQMGLRGKEFREDAAD